ncbi:hypothetical protein AB9E19_13215 [Rhizobium leguminosarum]|uniref:nSTAND1 domain-containing NTPase n=1 Tax=Rhizobium leguminosarum TaxID=384 RepID=UPI003F978272
MTPTLTDNATEAIELLREWPDRPYKGLNYYSSKDAQLFAERNQDIERCADILETTHVLLLHGRSGVGKSSFLRAGLVPFIERRKVIDESGKAEREPRLFGIRAAGEKEPLILRCTEDPVRRLYLKLGGRRSWDDGDERLHAKETATLLFERAREMKSRCPLYFVIDQAEDILNLNSRGADSQKRFVRLMDTLRFRSEVKLVLSLRTEFFGNFLDLMSIAPAELGVKEKQGSDLPPLSGVDMYLLDSIRDEPRLVNIIELPTKKHERYNFWFEDGLALRIARDLNEETKDFNLLPTLQVVCKELYDDVVLKCGKRFIRAEDYEKHGKIRGGIDTYINRNIEEVLRDVRRACDESAVRKWKMVLGSLVGRSGPGSVVGLLDRAASIEAVAQREEVHGVDSEGSTVEVLNGLAQEERRLLRIVPDMEGGNWYGLGHDALAPALFAWVDAAEKVEAERRQSEDRWRTQKEAIEEERAAEKVETRDRLARARYLAGTAGMIVVLGLAGYCGLVFKSYQSVSKDALELATQAESAEFRVTGLRLGQAMLASHRLFFGTAIDRVEIESQLRGLLLRSPVWAASGSAVSVDVPTKIALVMRGGYLFAQQLSSTNPEFVLGHIPETWQGEAGPTSIGFIGKTAVAVRGRRLYFQKSGSGSSDEFGDFDLTTVVPSALEEAAFFPEVSDGTVRLYFFSPVSPLRIVLITSDELSEIVSFKAPKRKGISDVITITNAGNRPIPVFSGDNKRLALVSGGIAADAVLIRGFHQSTNDWKFGSQEIALAALRQPGPGPATLNFFPTTAFLGNSGVLLVRDSIDKVTVYSADGWSKNAIGIDKAIQGYLPSSLPFLRPPFGAIVHNNFVRVGWTTPSGLAIGEAKPPSSDSTGRFSSINTLVWGGNPLQRVSFVADGDHVYGLSRTDSGEPQSLYWDTSPDRQRRLRELDDPALVAEMCRVVSLVGNPTLSRFEQLKTIIMPVDLPSPCQEQEVEP